MTPGGSIKMSSGDHQINMYSVADNFTESVLTIQSFGLDSFIWLRKESIDIEHENTKVILEKDKITVSAKTEVLISSPTVNISCENAIIEASENVEVGGDDFSMVLAERLGVLFDIHNHNDSTTAPGGPPLTPNTWVEYEAIPAKTPVSTKVKLKGNQ